jgi:hypothetical protein
VYVTAAALLVASGLGVVAQQGGARQQRPTGDQITLVYEREVFSYRGADRRDPFRPLTDDNQMGPRFQDLSLQGIIYSSVPGESVALLRAGQDRVFRARVGDVIGNSRVIEIGPTRVVMAVETFGTIRQEILEMPQRGGAER